MFILIHGSNCFIDFLRLKEIQPNNSTFFFRGTPAIWVMAQGNLLVVAFYRINIKNNWVTGIFSRRRT